MCVIIKMFKYYVLQYILSIIPLLYQNKTRQIKPFHVGIHWIVHIEYTQMRNHVPGFQSSFRFFASFCNGQISH